MKVTDPQLLAAWVALSRVPPLGSRVRMALLEHFGDVRAVCAAPRAELERVLNAVPGRYNDRAATLAAIDEGCDPDRFAPDLAWLADEHRHLVAWGDPAYPPLLREIPDPPVVLYVQGDPAVLARPQLAIVGSRNPTPTGRENAAAFAKTLAGAGLTITSGLALGIDGAAHRGALAGGGATIAVAGTGLDRVYPPRHRDLAHAIARHGALVSEYPLGTPPRAENFPVRNRLISGLSLGVLVVEAALQSGSLITARLATEQGREVFAVPGSIHSPLARGCHALIRQGAKLVETAQDVLEELGALAQVASTETHTRANVSPDEEALLAHVGYDSINVDDLVERSGLTPDRVSSMLLRLELRGLIVAGPGGTYQRAGGA